MNEYEQVTAVNQQCPIDQLLDMLGVQRQPGKGAWQLRCPFHKEGMEKKWSARAYKDTNKLWCFTEDRMYFAVDLIKHQLGLSTQEAIAWAVGKFKLNLANTEIVATVKDEELDELERKLRKHKNKADLSKYRQVAYAITSIRQGKVGGKRSTVVQKIKEALNRLGEK